MKSASKQLALPIEENRPVKFPRHFTKHYAKCLLLNMQFHCSIEARRARARQDAAWEQAYFKAFEVATLCYRLLTGKAG